MKQLFRFFSQILLLLILIVSIRKIDTAVNYKLTSIFYGRQGFSMDLIDSLSTWSGKRPAIIVFFTYWCPYYMDMVFGAQLTNMWNNKTIPLITWMPFGCNRENIQQITKLIYNNTFDVYLDQFTDRLKIWLAGNDNIYGNDDDRRVYIRLGHEMNGNWYPWSQNTTPNDYVLAWRHVYNIFSNKGLNSTRIQWIWSVNHNDIGIYTAEEYWVGDNYVDWLGIDGYNFGETKGSPWLWPNKIFDNMIARIRKLSSTKPLSINEYGSTSMRPGNISDVTNKTEWLNQFCDYISINPIKMASYFNIEKETDWMIFGGEHGDIVWNNFHAYSAYRNCLQSNEWIEANMTNPRLITDEQFAGRF